MEGSLHHLECIVRTVPPCSTEHTLFPSLHNTCLSICLCTFATISVCLYVSVPFNLCNHCNHTLSVCLRTSQPFQPLKQYLSVYLSLYLAAFATLVTIPVCLYVSVPCNLSNICNRTCLSICFCTSQPLQPLRPYLSVYLSLYFATFATFGTIPVCLSVALPCNLCTHIGMSICLCTLQPYFSVCLPLDLATLATLATVSVCLYVLRTLTSSHLFDWPS